MKKIIIILLAAISIVTMSNIEDNDYIIVPKESIRFRIIPNSNTLEDINMKEKVKNEVASVIDNISANTTIEDSRNSIQESIPTMETKITNLFQRENYDKTFNIKYGQNYFPEKIYKGVKYESGDYESVVIEIGESAGSNYWCVLFPPLCLLEAEESEEVEYKFFVSEIIKKILKK